MEPLPSVTGFDERSLLWEPEAPKAVGYLAYAAFFTRSPLKKSPGIRWNSPTEGSSDPPFTAMGDLGQRTVAAFGPMIGVRGYRPRIECRGPVLSDHAVELKFW